MISAAILAIGCKRDIFVGPYAAGSAPLTSIEGNWNGSASSLGTIRFIVVKNAITEIQFSATCNSGTFVFGTPVPVVNGQFHAIFSNVLVVDGTFLSDTHAQGVTSKLNGCFDSGNVGWDATN